jgi:maleylacetoacetate isomerase
MKLYGYFRSSAAYRVRIALNLKGIAVEHVPVHLVKEGGQHRKAEYLLRNPQGLVPALELDDGTLLTQSLAIIEYLDKLVPSPRLIPEDTVLAAKVRAAALTIACEIHPLNNLRVLNYLKGPLGQPQESVETWMKHWMLNGGLDALEALLPGDDFCFGNTPTPTAASYLICSTPTVSKSAMHTYPKSAEWKNLAKPMRHLLRPILPNNEMQNKATYDIRECKVGRL